MHQTLEARQSSEPRPTACALRRVSVYADSLHVDLVLSAVVPVGSLIPPIVDTLAAQRYLSLERLHWIRRRACPS